MPASLMTGPHLSISAIQERRELRRRRAHHHDAELLEPLLGHGIGQSAATVSACILPTISGGVLAGAKSAYQDDTSKPGTPASAIGGSSGAAGERLARRHRQAAQLATLDQRQHRTDIVEHHVDPPGDEVVERRAGAAIGHVQHLDPGHALEQLAGEVNRGAVTGGGEGDLARLALA